LLHVIQELFKVYVSIVVAIALFQKLVDEQGVFGKFALVCLENYGQFFPADAPVMVKVEVPEGKGEVVAIVGSSLGETGRYELIVSQPPVMIYVHMLDNLPQIAKFLAFLRCHKG
jgi:hypothetical protein